jgi:hypothetical protein
MNHHGGFRFPANSSNLENPYLGWFGMVMKNEGSTLAQGGFVSFRIASSVTATGYIGFKAGTYGMSGCGGNAFSKLARHKVAGWLPTTIVAGATGVVMWCGAASVILANTATLQGAHIRLASTAGMVKTGTTYGDGAIVGMYAGYTPATPPPKISAIIFPWRM